MPNLLFYGRLVSGIAANVSHVQHSALGGDPDYGKVPLLFQENEE
jgi:hypothetical protein